MPLKPFTVEYIGQRAAPRAATPYADITERVTHLNGWTDTGSGEVSSASIMLDCAGGAFTTNDNSGATPAISIYDEIKVTVGHPWEAGRQSRVFFVSRLQPQRTSDGAVLMLSLLGREDYLRQHVAMGGHANDTWRSIVASICGDLLTPGSLGTRQPQFSCSAATIDGIPEHAAGTMDFGQGERTSYDLLMEVLGAMNRPVSAGGAGQILSLTFRDRTDDVVDIHIHARGSRNASVADASKPLVDTASAGFVSCLPVIEQQEGNVKVVRGQQDFGSVPREFAVWRGALEVFDNYPEYSAAVAYPEGARVRHMGRAYSRLAAGTGAGHAPTSAAHWDEVHVHDLLPAGFDYSPWTAGRAQEWQNMASLPQNNRGVDYTSPAYPDGNLQVRDDTFRRDWATYGPLAVASGTATPPSGYGALRDGDRVLCSASSTGSDPYGRPYANSLAARVGSRLVVAVPAASLSGGQQVAVLQTGRLWEWTRDLSATTPGGLRASFGQRAAHRSQGGDDPLGWRDVTETKLGSDCFHRPVTIENVQGFLRGRQKPGGDDYSVGSAVRIVYQETLSSATLGWWDALLALTTLGGLADLIAALTGPEEEAASGAGAGSMGWWATLFMAPWPPTTTGGATRGSLFAPPLLDLRNSNVSASGATDVYAPGGEELGETAGIAFLFSFEIRLGGLDTSPMLGFQGNFPFRLFVYDADGNVWVKDEVIRYLGEPQQVTAFWSDFRPWFARAPLGVSEAILNWTLPERLELGQLNQRRVRMVTMQFDRSYDEVGRYDPWKSWDTWFSTAVAGAGTIRYAGTIDALHLIKDEVRVARAPDAALRTVSDPVEVHGGVSNSLQLANVASASLAVAAQERAIYPIRTVGSLAARLDDTVFYRDALMERAADMGAATRRLEVTRVQHSYTPEEGWVTELTGVTRVGA